MTGIHSVMPWYIMSVPCVHFLHAMSKEILSDAACMALPLPQVAGCQPPNAMA
jgi:hypothetical protein